MDLESRDKKKLGLKRFFSSFKYAFHGIIYAIKSEPNMLIHVLVAIVVILSAFLFQISTLEWIICLLFIGLILSAELINTSIESVVDLICRENRYLAKVAKDTAAGAVLVLAFFALIVGIIIFLPKMIELFS